STLSRYLDISLAMLRETNESLSAGPGCIIAPGADVSQSILWDDVVVESGARVNRAVLADGVRVRAAEVIENAVVVSARLVRGKTSPSKAQKGEIRGDNFVVPLT
ncbi:MAG: hypothetical protein ACRD8U_08995, partial [Pyrinomonadaceae bacterium]